MSFCQAGLLACTGPTVPMLPSVTLAFSSGLLLGSLIPFFPFSLSILLLLAAIIQTVLEWRQRVWFRQATACFCCVLAGILFWFFAVERVAHVPFLEKDFERPQSLTGRIIAPVQQSPDRLVIIVRLDPLAGRSDGQLVVRLTWRAPERLLYHGDRVRFRAKLRAPGGPLNPGGFDYAEYLERQGIDATTTVNGTDGVEFLESGRDNLQWMVWNQFDRWRGTIRLSALRVLEQPALGLYLGVIVGERGYLDQELRDRFMVTGTVHLLSISGSHLGLVAILTFLAVKHVILRLPSPWLLLLSRTVTPTRLAAIVTVVPVTAYACLAGAELATIRSLVMVVVALVAKWFGYEQRIFHALSVAAVAILWHDPRAIYDISFQLSFVSVCAIAWWLCCWPDGEDQERRSSSQSLSYRIVRWGKDALLLSAVVTLATLPLVALYFNQIPWIGLFSNVIAVPVMGALLVPLGLAAAIAQNMVGEGLPFAGWLQWSFDLFVSSVNNLSSLPGGEWHVASPSIPLMVVFYGCLLLMASISAQRWVHWASVSVLLVIFSWWVWSPRLLLDGDRFRVTFLDVSQGDSAVIEFPDGGVVLIDGGTSYGRFDMGRGVIGPYLWNRRIHTIDHVIATHPQLDHVGGLAWVLRHFTVKHFWGTGDTREELFYHRLQEAIGSQGLTEQSAKEGTEIVSDTNCRLIALNPSDAMDMRLPISSRRVAGHTLNNKSIVTEFICGRHTILFTADIEQEALLRLSHRNHSEPVEVLKVPHHGAASSLELNWLDTVRPRVAVISVGHGNSYGHPAPAVVQAYLARGVSVYRTDNDGAVWITGRRSQPGVRIHRTREELIHPVTLSLVSWRDELENLKKLLARWEE